MKLLHYAIAFLLVLASCTTQEPTQIFPGEDSDQEIENVSLTLRLIPPGDWTDSVCSPVRASSRHIRLAVSVDSPGIRTGWSEFSYPTSILSQDTIQLEIPHPVRAGEIHVSVWCDILTDNPLAYDISSPQNVVPLLSYGEENDLRFALTAEAEADLSGVGDSASISVPLVSPLGRYRIIASDYSQFLKATADERAAGETFTTTLRYLDAIPGSFDITTGEAIQPAEGVGFSKPLPVIDIPGIEIAPVSDWIFLPPEGMETEVEISVTDSKGKEWSRTSLSIPMRRGVITTLRAPVLTTYMTDEENR